MIIKVFLFVLFVWACEGYSTNVRYDYVWTTKSIDYYLWNENPDKINILEPLVNTTLSTLETNVGNLITWKRVTEAQARSKDRYIVFVLAKARCITSTFAAKAGSIIPLSNEYGCDTYTGIHNILRALGFVSPHLRIDRDEHIIIHFDNIAPIDHQIHRKCSLCMESDDKVYEKYDFDSLLHPPRFNPYSIDFNKPIISEKEAKDNGSLKNSYDYAGRTMSPTDIAVFKAVYGKKKLKKNYK